MYSLLISIEDAAKAIGIGRTKTYEFIQSGEIKTAKLGGRRLVLVSSLESFVNTKAEEVYSD